MRRATSELLKIYRWWCVRKLSGSWMLWRLVWWLWIRFPCHFNGQYFIGNGPKALQSLLPLLSIRYRSSLFWSLQELHHKIRRDEVYRPMLQISRKTQWIRSCRREWWTEWIFTISCAQIVTWSCKTVGTSATVTEPCSVDSLIHSNLSHDISCPFYGILPHRRLYNSLLADHEVYCSTCCDCTLSGQEADLFNWTGRTTGHFHIPHHISHNFRCNNRKVLQSPGLILGRTWN